MSRIAGGHVVERGPEIGLLALALVERAGTATDAAEVEAQHRAADARQTLGSLVDRLGVHRPAKLRMRVGEDNCRALTCVPVAGWSKQRFERARRADQVCKGGHASVLVGTGSKKPGDDVGEVLRPRDHADMAGPLHLLRTALPE